MWTWSSYVPPPFHPLALSAVQIPSPDKMSYDNWHTFKNKPLTTFKFNSVSKSLQIIRQTNPPKKLLENLHPSSFSLPAIFPQLQALTAHSAKVNQKSSSTKLLHRKSPRDHCPLPQPGPPNCRQWVSSNATSPNLTFSWARHRVLPASTQTMPTTTTFQKFTWTPVFCCRIIRKYMFHHGLQLLCTVCQHHQRPFSGCRRRFWWNLE